MQTILAILLLGTAFMAVKATPLSIKAGAQDAMDFDADAIQGQDGKLRLRMLEETTEIEHFTLGTEIEGAHLIFYNTKSFSYDAPQDIVAELSYPAADYIINDAQLSQIVVHVEGSEGMECQVYVLNGGIGDTSVTLQFVANNTASLRYVVLGYGTNV